MKDEPIWRRYARLFGADPRADTEDELSFHYEMRVQDYVRRGMDEAAARLAARERMGDLHRVRVECEEQDLPVLRRNRRREWFGDLGRDLAYGVRVLVRTPGFAIMAVLTLALGIGATTAIYSVVDRVLLAPLPYPEPERLVHVWEVSPQGNDHNPVSPGNYVDWSTRTRSFAALGAYRGVYGVALTGDGEPVQLQVSDATPAALNALGATPLIGRMYNDEDVRAAGSVVLLSHRLWQQRFGAARNVIGQAISIDGRPHTVVGVMPSTFEFPRAAAQLWRPIGPADIDATERRSHNFFVLGRLEAGVTPGGAQAELNGLALSLAGAHPQFMKGWGVNLVPMHEDLTVAARPLLTALLATVLVVLLIACANLANLLLAKAVSRTGEIALRGALGAGRVRIVRQLLTESLVIAAAGGVIGVLIAAVGLRLLLSSAPDQIPLLGQVTIDWNVLGFAAFLTVSSTFVFGLIPAVQLARADLQSTLRARSGGGSRNRRLRGALLSLEIALSVVLLVGAGLMVRSLWKLQHVDLGYATGNLVSAFLDLPRSRYNGASAYIDHYARLIDRLRDLPEITSVAGTGMAPAQGSSMTFSFRIEGREAANPSGREDPEEMHAVTPDYFRTMGIPVVRGRAFDTRDRVDAAPAVIINQTLARKHWPDQDPVGKRINFGRPDSPWMEIVGVVGDTRMASPDQEPVPALYIPHAQITWNWMSWFGIVARVRPGTELNALRSRFEAVLWEFDDQVPLQTFEWVRDAYGQSIARRSFAMRLILVFAALATTLTVIGLYGLVSFTVAQEKREIGVRIALGARPGDVTRQVIARTLKLSLMGLFAGLATALSGTRLLSTLLYDVKITDPFTLIAIAVLITASAAFAAWLPARRATQEDPLLALRG